MISVIGTLLCGCTAIKHLCKRLVEIHAALWAFHMAVFTLNHHRVTFWALNLHGVPPSFFHTFCYTYHHGRCQLLPSDHRVPAFPCYRYSNEAVSALELHEPVLLSCHSPFLTRTSLKSGSNHNELISRTIASGVMLLNNRCHASCFIASTVERFCAALLPPIERGRR